MKWFLKVLKQYADFDGRARRKEFWMFYLFYIIFAIVAAYLDNLLGLTPTGYPYGALYLLYGLAVFLPGLGVSVRRMHDIGKSGWMVFIGFIPLIGVIWLLILFAKDSSPGDNQYGPNPKESIA